MIDLHSHILPGLDDGAPDSATSEAMARVATADGVHTIAATPHIREDHPFPPEEIPPRAEELERRFAAAGIDLRVVAAGEVALTRCADLDDDQLAALCLGGRHLLVESPYTHATDLVETMVFELQGRGFRPLLAHPERSPSFIENPKRLATLVERGVGCSITAGSVTGRFGRTVQKAAFGMLSEGLVHDIASDAHDPFKRRPTLRSAVDAVEAQIPGLAGRAEWFVTDSPAAIVAGGELQEPPQPSRRRGRLRRRF